MDRMLKVRCSGRDRDQAGEDTRAGLGRTGIGDLKDSPAIRDDRTVAHLVETEG
jgi:hypothetical protein